MRTPRRPIQLYGERCGAQRVLDVFDEFGVKTTWFLNGAGVAPGERADDETMPLLAELGYRYYMGFLDEDLPYTLRTWNGDLTVRAQALREFFAYARAKPKVWFPRCVDEAGHYRARYGDLYVQTWPHYGTGLPRPMAG